MNTQDIALKLLNIPQAKKDHWSELLKDPVFQPVYNYANLRDQREHALKKVSALFGSKIASVKQFATNPQNIFSAHEFVMLACPATFVKYTVQMKAPVSKSKGP